MPPVSFTPNNAQMSYPFEDFCFLEILGTFFCYCLTCELFLSLQWLLDTCGGALPPTSSLIFPLAECFSGCDLLEIVRYCLGSSER